MVQQMKEYDGKKLESLLGTGLELLSVVLLHLLDHVLVDWVDQVENLISSLLKSLEEWGLGDSGSGLSSDVEDVLLAFLHLAHVVLEGNHLFSRLGGVESQQVSELGSVGGVLVDSEFKVLGELLIEFLVVLGVFLDLSEHFKALLDDVLFDDLQDFVLLEGLSGDVKRKILRVDDSLHEGKPLWDKFFAVVHDEDSSDVELDVVLLLLSLEKIEWSSLWHEEERSEFKLSLNGEMLDGQMFFPVVRKSLVESSVLVLGDILRLSHPDWLGLVKGLEFLGNLLDFLGLLLLLVTVVRDLLLGGLLDEQLNWEANELGVLLD